MTERILVVDDEPGILHALQRLLRQGLVDGNGQRYLVDECASGELALEHASVHVYALAISDYRMPEMNGVDFLSALRRLQPDCQRIILSGYTDLNGLIRAVNEAGITRFIAKPWTDYELLSAVREVLKVRELTLESRRLADIVRTQQGQLNAHEAELRRLERMEPGITHVNWAEDGSFILEDPDDARS
ncbi:Response regulator receiver domain-containing protein [Roseateles sp. YR242]|uniref:response regulator n=1 Tax=Roseateles sp. YR242 TaxID=1855305 RepID=UPI0008B7C39A|nr:response regulator [Roseateles sp. YR242]SEL89283.1 Response regulator receiver domain-containing protein [Roseateles sp. YR242]